MPKLIILPHETLCPQGRVLQAQTGDVLIDVMLDNDIEIDHACEKSCACTTCHVIVREGFGSLEPAEDTEEDMLDKAWGVAPHSRLSCQVVVGEQDLVVEIPKYSINMVKER
ncbi:MAG: ISC system 2Fe-2S type ferredoxin [Gallionellaceae bacterium]|jgi:2Fe-2S ferredoxin|nr:ISC system 2Fe-2S type ferredoxin [Gallionellaceae bacterium]